ncbi:membrane protein insertion efficiency factor YidD [Candidatus Parcubacteria bacterium 4484_255]|nr:MAG: membrane protein insertion efficiency factor YidD [Candidatus Parcubacteria bacterium 4484_255]
MNNPLAAFPKLLILRLIRFYQKTFSPDHGPLSLIHPWPGVCKFRPTCSEYAYLAIDKYGILKGSLKAIWRILRCNPWSKGGWDEP